jgi:hypothetical protein
MNTMRNLLLLAATVSAHPWVSSAVWGAWPAASTTPSAQSASPTKQVFYGRFISAPSGDELSIKTGAVLVSSSDGQGVIEAAVWDVEDVASAISQLGASGDTPVVQATDSGFFFPGFIGKLVQ